MVETEGFRLGGGYRHDRSKKDTMFGFEVKDIKKCSICGKTHALGIREMISETYAGLMECSGCVEFCVGCFAKNAYQNNNGFTFLKYKDTLFCHKPSHYLEFEFSQVLSSVDIDRAFDPDRYDFEKWLNN